MKIKKVLNNLPAGTEEILMQSGHSEACGILAVLSLLAKKVTKRDLNCVVPESIQYSPQGRSLEITKGGEGV